MKRRCGQAQIAVLLMLWIGPAFAAEGGDVPNGGDSVYCNKSDSSSFEGYYSLDYLMEKATNPRDELVEVTHYLDSLKDILALVSKHSPELKYSLAEFLKYLNNFSDYTKPQIWIPARYGLVNIHDENLFQRLPLNCLRKDSTQVPSTLQTVIRLFEGSVQTYRFDERILDSLDQMQKSFLFTHEWLWNFTSNPEVIRRVNFFLHTRRAKELTPSEFNAVLAGLGLNFRMLPRIPVCSFVVPLKRELEKSTGKTCEVLRGDESFESLFQLDLSNREMEILPIGQLNQLSQLRQINLSSNRLDLLFPHLFSGLIQLREIYLSQNQITELSDQQFNGLHNLVKMNLANNAITAISPLLWFDQQAIVVDLTQNRISAIPPDALAVAPHLKFQSAISIDLSGNNISSLSQDFLGNLQTIRSEIHLFLYRNPISDFDPELIRSLFVKSKGLHIYLDQSDVTHKMLKAIPECHFATRGGGVECAAEAP